MQKNEYRIITNICLDNSTGHRSFKMQKNNKTKTVQGVKERPWRSQSSSMERNIET